MRSTACLSQKSKARDSAASADDDDDDEHESNTAVPLPADWQASDDGGVFAEVSDAVTDGAKTGWA